MEAVFPITQRNGEPYHTLSDFTKMFDQAKSGRYLLGQGYGWHSGVHLTSKMVPWGKGLRPIQSMLDGKIIAYRIHEDYQKTLYKGQELKFSNNFVLIEHECQNPDDSNDVFKFYSLYMHLAPPADIGANSSPSTRYKMVMEQGKRNVRTFKLDSEPKQESKLDKVGMSKGTILEYLYAEEKETHKYNINGTGYHMIKCRVVEAGDQNSTREKGMEGKLVWFAAGKDSEFDILENTSVMQPVPVSEPPWMKQDAAKLRNGSVVPLTVSVEGTPDLGISINAGDEIGYMGLHEYSNDINATKKEDNRVHIELFSIDEPPEYFKKLISPPNAEETPLIVIDGSDSDGALSSENAFFVSLAKEVSKSRKSSDEAADSEEVDFSSATPKELKTYLNNKRKHFERVIVKHPSDWHVEKSDSIYERVHAVAREIYEQLLSRGFVSLEDFENSPWRKKVLAEYDVFSEHERERAKEFSWLESFNLKLDEPTEEKLWHYWPFAFNLDDVKSGLAIDFNFIRELEGTENVGYVPDPEKSQSGVTIATGFDLGARNERDLVNLGFSGELFEKLKPYLGLKKQKALDKLNEIPLIVTNEELALIDQAIKKSETDRIVELYNSHSVNVRFEELPWQAQTVIASVAYQFGYLPSETSEYWKQVVDQDWQSAYENLVDFGCKYETRRKKEAKLLKEIL